MTLSHDDLVALAKTAGFSDKDSKTAAAIALAESGGNPNAHNSKPPDDSYGLWQINMLGKMGQQRKEQYHLSAYTDLFNPSTNARVAYGIFKGSGFNAWTTYTSGKYKEHLSDSGDTADKGGSGGGSSTPSAFNPINGVSGAINAFGETLFKTGANIGGIILAITLLIAGIVLLARSQVASVIPAGKAAKIAKGVLTQ